VRALQVVLPTLGLAWQAIQPGIEELVVAALKWDEGNGDRLCSSAAGLFLVITSFFRNLA